MTISGKGEAEMKKDKEWAFIELGKLFPSHAEMHDFPDDTTVMKCELLNKVYDILSQLDQPEMLSQEWIEGNSVYASSDGVTEEYVHVDDLQNLLVPKPELPVIPKFVANWIEGVRKQDKTLIFAITHIYAKNEISESPNEEEKKVFQWMESNDNEEVFARAWLDGYEVEEEQKYVLKIGNLYLAEPLADMASDIVRMTRDTEVAYRFTDRSSIDTHLEKFEGTKAVKVEELE